MGMSDRGKSPPREQHRAGHTGKGSGQAPGALPGSTHHKGPALKRFSPAPTALTP